jgi:ABC-type phosphate transport system substrate-binding protein
MPKHAYEHPNVAMRNLPSLLISVTLLGGTAAASAQVAVVAASGSPIGNLTPDQAAALYLGKLDKLPGVGSVLLVDQAESAAVRDIFYSKATGKTPAQVKAIWTRLVFSGKAQLPKEAPNSAEVKKLLAAHPDAVGYIEKSAVDGSVKVLLSLD